MMKDFIEPSAKWILITNGLLSRSASNSPMEGTNFRGPFVRNLTRFFSANYRIIENNDNTIYYISTIPELVTKLCPRTPQNVVEIGSVH